jgi:amino acid permease
MIDVAYKAVTFSQFVTYWTGPSDQLVHSVLEITFFFIPPILVNFLNVRLYGEVEFVLTAIKVQVILGIILLGIVIAVGGGHAQLSGTDTNTYQPVSCNSTLNTLGNCTSLPGIGRLSLNYIY